MSIWNDIVWSVALNPAAYPKPWPAPFPRTISVPAIPVVGVPCLWIQYEYVWFAGVPFHTVKFPRSIESLLPLNWLHNPIFPVVWVGELTATPSRELPLLSLNSSAVPSPDSIKW